MRVDFESAVLLDAFVGTSQRGNRYGRLRFLSADLDVYEIFCSADFAEHFVNLPPKSQCDLVFDLQPSREGGVRLVGVSD